MMFLLNNIYHRPVFFKRILSEAEADLDARERQNRMIIRYFTSRAFSFMYFQKNFIKGVNFP